MSGSGKQPKYDKHKVRRQARFDYLTAKFGMEAAIRMMRPPEKQDKPLPLIFRIQDVGESNVKTNEASPE
jgi:hypothetical protein